MAIDHMGFTVADSEASRRFHAMALTPQAIGIVMQGGGRSMAGKAASRRCGSAFRANRPAQFTSHFPEAIARRFAPPTALRADGRYDGTPGIRSRYRRAHYAAYVPDSDGRNIEAVCHAPEA